MSIDSNRPWAVDLLLALVPRTLAQFTLTFLSSVLLASRTRKMLKSPRRVRSLKMEIRRPMQSLLMPRRRVTSPLAIRSPMTRLLVTRRKAISPLATRNLRVVIKSPKKRRVMKRSLKVVIRRRVTRRMPSLRPSQKKLLSKRMALSLRLIRLRLTSRLPCQATLTCRWSTM